MFNIYEIIAIVLFLMLTVFLLHIKARKEHPPGPLGLPVFGMIPIRIIEFLLSKWLKTMTEAEKFTFYRDKYGPIWSEEFGKQRIITLSSWELVSDAFLNNADLFSGRPKLKIVSDMGLDKGIISSDEELWKENRQLATKALRELGMGKHSLNEKISEEADELIFYLKRQNGDHVNLFVELTKGVSNVITRLVFNERNDYDNLSFRKYIDNLRVVTRSDDANRNLTLLPKLFNTSFGKKICPEIEEFLDANQYCNDFIKDKCSARALEQPEIADPECVFDYFYRYRYSESSTLSAAIRDSEIMCTMKDLYDAGIDTTSGALTFCCLMLGRLETVQQEIREELLTLSNDFGHVALEQRKNCPKLLSFIDEVQRYFSLIPKVFHRVLSPTLFHGYKLYPTDIIFGDFANLFRCTDLFEKSSDFVPDRFIDKATGKYCPSKYLIPFGIGKRSCLGESIATVEMFLFLTKIILSFRITLTKTTTDNFDRIIDGHTGIVHGPLGHFMKLQCL